MHFETAFIVRECANKVAAWHPPVREWLCGWVPMRFVCLEKACPPPKKCGQPSEVVGLHFSRCTALGQMADVEGKNARSRRSLAKMLRTQVTKTNTGKTHVQGTGGTPPDSDLRLHNPCPQHGNTPANSHRDALRGVFDHCAPKCRAHCSTLHEKFGTVATMGGIQITLDTWTPRKRASDAVAVLLHTKCGFRFVPVCGSRP